LTTIHKSQVNKSSAKRKPVAGMSAIESVGQLPFLSPRIGQGRLLYHWNQFFVQWKFNPMSSQNFTALQNIACGNVKRACWMMLAMLILPFAKYFEAEAKVESN
jgi:hypothetical protein